MVQALRLRLIGKSQANLSPKGGSAQHCGRRRLQVCNAIGFSNAPIEAIVGGGVLVIGSLAYLASEAIKASNTNGAPSFDQESNSSVDMEESLPRENGILVFGASGRAGREIVAKV